VSFLKARNAIKAVSGLPAEPMRLIASCMLDNLVLYLRAAFAERGINASIDSLPFGTLQQHLAAAPDGTAELALVLPWDLCPLADWRSGSPKSPEPPEDLIAAGAKTIVRISERCLGAVAYIDTPAIPVFRNTADQARLDEGLRSVAAGAGARILGPDAFSLTTYLHSGAPVAGNRLADVAEALAAQWMLPGRRGIGKVLVTDLDNCLWRGTVGEDGPENVSADAEGESYKHFIYQSYLGRLRRDGIMLAVASRNDPDLARAPLEKGGMPLGVDDFIAFESSYGSKSDAVRSIARNLNLGLANIVMVDDNPVELAEVNAALPEVATVLFPGDSASLPNLFSELNLLFHRDALTDEDRRRNELYRARAAVADQAAKAESVEDFLRGLDMELTIFERTPETWSRAIQLINKTNQFNLNGQRWSEENVSRLLSDGGRLFTAKLTDKSGDHGEILSFLVDGRGIAQAFVMSCRVFQRRIEYAFLLAIKDRVTSPLDMTFRRTERNTPFAMFTDGPGFTRDDGALRCDLDEIAACHADDLTLFRIVFEDA